MLRISHQTVPEGYALLQPEGNLDAFTVAPFRRVLADLASAPRLVVDLSLVTFIDSAGLGALIGGIRHSRELGGGVVLACSRPGILRVLQHTGVGTMVDVVDSVDAAAARLQSAPAGTPSPLRARPAPTVLRAGAA